MKVVVQFVFLQFLILCELAIGEDLTSPTYFQEDTQKRSGYLKIECDSLDIDIYVDGKLVGQTPIFSPIPLDPGVHTITYLQPDYITLLNTHHKNREIRALLDKGIKKVTILPGETVHLKLWWTPFQRAFENQQKQTVIKSLAGVVFVTVLLFLFLQTYS